MEIAWEKVAETQFGLSEYKDRTGRLLPCYELKYDECMYVAAKWQDETRAKLVKRWKELEDQRIAEKQNPELSINKAIDAYRIQGKTDAWIATRMSCIVQRNAYIKTPQEHDVKSYGNCTDNIWYIWHEGKTNERKGKACERHKSLGTHEYGTAIRNYAFGIYGY